MRLVVSSQISREILFKSQGQDLVPNRLPQKKSRIRDLDIRLFNLTCINKGHLGLNLPCALEWKQHCTNLTSEKYISNYIRQDFPNWY